MISNKALATLFFITLNMQRAAASSPDGTQGSSPSDKSTLKKRQGPAPKIGEVLRDVDNVMVPVGVQRGGNKEIEILQGCAHNTKKAAPVVKEAVNTTNDVLPGSEQIMTRVSICQRLFSRTAASIAKGVKLLIEEGKHWAAICLAITKSRDDFLGLTCSIIKTFEQCKGLVNCLKFRNLVTSFYVYGNIKVVKRAIIAESRDYNNEIYDEYGNLEVALPIALKKDRHDRVIELLDVRMEVTAERDKLDKQKGWTTSFECFVSCFLRDLAPWKNGMALRRFLAFRGEELRSKYPDILDTLCEKLVYHLGDKLHFPFAKNLLVDLIGQPLLLTPVVFARGSLCHDIDEYRSDFIKYGWRETIQEGLKTECYGGGKELWRVMQEKYPDQFPGEFPDTEEARVAACAHLPTKQQKEEEWIEKYEKWIKENALILYDKLKPHGIINLLPDVIWPIVFSYAATPIDLEDSTATQK